MKGIKIILQGGGEHAKVVLDCLLDEGANVLALFDPKFSGELFGVEQRGQYDPLFEPDSKVIVAIGDNAIRKKVTGVTQHSFTNAIHSSTVISSRVSMGVGCMVLHGAIIQANTVIGDHVIINTATSIDHDCEIDNYVHLAPRAVLCGRVKVGEGALVGAGAVVLPGISIGAWATIGAGAVVTKNVGDGAVVVGNPAGPIQNSKLKSSR